MSSCSRKGKSIALPLVLFGTVTLAWAGPYADLDARLGGRPDAEALTGLRRLAGDDADALVALDKGPQAARAYIRLRAGLEGAPASEPPAIAGVRSDDRVASSWLGRALRRIEAPKIDRPQPRRVSSVPLFGSWVTVLMWGVLAVVAVGAVALLWRNVQFAPRRRRKAIMNEEEALRSADAWIEEADGLVAAGRYREAVRGLYVAGLMRLDEAGVARFERHETNWEHLRRIEANAERLPGVDARSATILFDRCWYGHLPTTADDAATMRAWYDAITLKAREPRA